MGKLRIDLFLIFILISSTIASPFLFSTAALSQTEGTTSESSGTSTTAEPVKTETAPAETTSGGTSETTAAQTTTAETPPPEPTTTTETKEETVTTVERPPETPSCPTPPQPPACGADQGVNSLFDKGCLIGYECISIPKAEVGLISACPEIPPPTISCTQNEQLSKVTDERGCVTGYSCMSISRPEQTGCPAITPEKPECKEGSASPVFDKGCLIYYTCVPQGCRQETDASGFVRVVCHQERTCSADAQQAELKSSCAAQGGNPVPFTDPSGCTFYDCRFDNREVNPNPIKGHQSCPKPEDIHNEAKLCKEAGLNPGIVFEGGCKIVKCSQEAGPVCKFVSDSERSGIENECSSRGLPVVRSTDNSGCGFYRCGEGQEQDLMCQRGIPQEAYRMCNGRGGEMVVKTDTQGCIVFSQCIAPGDEQHAYVQSVEEVPDTTVLLSLALKLEQLRIELQKLSTESNEIAKYYASTDSLDEERYNRVSVMFSDAAERVDEIKIKIRDNADQLTTDDMEEIKHDIKYIKEVTLKDILYLMLSNSEDVKETLEVSKKVSKEGVSLEELEQNVKSCGTDGSCFDKAIRTCKPVSFQPEGRNGPSLTIKGLKDGACILHVIMQSDNMVPPGYTRENFYMECRIKSYSLGVRGPEDIIPNCEGPMASFAKQFGGAAQISGEGDAFQAILDKEGGPGGCKTERECATFCIDNYDECRRWVKEHPVVGSLPSREELRRIASGESQSGERFEQTSFAGPGGCRGPQECDRFCRSNPKECLRWCDENPDMCPQQRGGLPEESKSGSEFVPQQPVSRAPQSGVQACVGCLNNGICDIGECSECTDCLRGERSITGEITRVG